jgi:hypothetical protein
LSKGRHSADRVAGHRRTTTGVRKAAPGARKAPPEARKGSPARVGGARVAGRRVADGDGRPVVLTALGSGEKLFALVPLAMLSVASVAGLATMGNGDPSAFPSPSGSGIAAASPGHEATRHPMAAPPAPSSARTAMAETASPVTLGEDAGSDAPLEARASTDQTASADSLVETRVEPAERPAEAEPTTTAATPSPSATPGPTDVDNLSRTEATARCLASGISTVDVLGLAACVEELLG